MRPTRRFSVRPFALFALAGVVASLHGVGGCSPDQPSVFAEGRPLGPDWISTAAVRMSNATAGGFDFADNSPEAVNARAKSRAQYGQ